jgi:predicted thioesterase
VLTGSLALGALLGAVRMAAGTHFLSSVLEAGVITVGVCAALSHLTRLALARGFVGAPCTDD